MRSCKHYTMLYFRDACKEQTFCTLDERTAWEVIGTLSLPVRSSPTELACSRLSDSQGRTKKRVSEENEGETTRLSLLIVFFFIIRLLAVAFPRLSKSLSTGYKFISYLNYSVPPSLNKVYY